MNLLKPFPLSDVDRSCWTAAALQSYGSSDLSHQAIDGIEGETLFVSKGHPNEWLQISFGHHLEVCGFA